MITFRQRIYILFLFLCFLLPGASPIFAEKNSPTLKLGEPLPANLFVELARVINPGVVNISTKIRPQRVQRYRDPFFDMLEQMYGLKGPQLPQNNKPRPHSLGTGFLIREDGLIVTNNHVIAGADEIDIQLNEKSDKLYKAKIIGSDDRTDIALIKIDGKSFPTLSLGVSSESQVGEWVAAFGNPYGQGHTMTKGVISAKERDLSEINRFPLIQTDAPINPGNSGGPLVNSKGQVIGVNAAIDPRAQGIGFAIPIDEVKKLLPELEKLGRIQRGFLGVQLAELDPQTAMALGLKDLDGAIIARVEKNTPASRSGLQPYDVVTEYNGTKVRNSLELRNLIADTNIGLKTTIKIMREGKPKTLNVTVGEVSQRTPPNRQNKKLDSHNSNELGFVVKDPTPELRNEYGIDDDVNKPLVIDVDPQGPSGQAGLLPGDIILDVNKKEVNTAKEAMRAIKKGVNTLRVVRQQSVVFIMVNSR